MRAGFPFEVRKIRKPLPFGIRPLGTADYAGVIPKGATLTLKLEEPIEVVVG